MTTPIWTPSAADIARANLTAFLAAVRTEHPSAAGVDGFATLYDWSVRHPEEFWAAVWRFCGVVAEERPGRDPWDAVGVGLDRMAPPEPGRGPTWFPGARLNFAENLLRWRDDRPALIAWDERGPGRRWTHAELAAEVARVAGGLRAAGVSAGDRVAGFLPNIPEAVIAMLAAASLGAVWSSCSPDFGAKGVLDRFGQIAPTVLFAADGYRYAGKLIDCRDRIREVV
ncbi:MAG TPA: AMP-binding protein, partial [Gemmatimonadales bacterium]|nr:AMP-binding protein [Gemmatimonadales bacterium]